MSASTAAQTRREVQADVDRVWAVVTDWPRHGGYLRTEVVADGPPGVGQRVTAVTSLGARLEDPMVVALWEPPTEGHGSVRLEKVGAPLGGWAQIGVRSLGPGRTELTWREEITVGGRSYGPVTRVLTGLMIRLLSRRLAKAAEADDG